MRNDFIQVFDLELAKSILDLSEDEMWEFLLGRVDQIKEMEHHQTGIFYALPYGIEHFRKMFLEEFEYEPDGLQMTLVNDFCFIGEPIDLGFFAISGFLDHANSCDVVKYGSFMPEADEETEAYYYQRYFYLLEPEHVQNIIKSLQKNVKNLSVNKVEDIQKLKEIKQICTKQKHLKAAIVYDM
jgi:hypothetical protein